MAKVEVKRKEPVTLPPIESVTLTLSKDEAERLMAVLGATHIDDGLSHIHDLLKYEAGVEFTCVAYPTVGGRVLRIRERD